METKGNTLLNRNSVQTRKTPLATLMLVLVLSLPACKDSAQEEFDKQLRVDIQLIDAYLAENSISAQVHSSGLRYVIHEPGSGAKPTLQECVKFNYVGKFLATEEEFDATENFKIRLSNLIAGFQVGMPLIAEGGSITLYIPSGLAYGRNGYPPIISANTNLIFDVELLDVTATNPTTGQCL